MEQDIPINFEAIKDLTVGDVQKMEKDLQPNQHKCLRCDYEWEGKKDPKACPRCKRYDWMKILIQMKGGKSAR